MPRDLKPDNVLIGRDGRVVITDFGIARVVEPEASGMATLGVATGTPAYMAPEQVEGGAIDARVDIYAVGEILFEMLTGSLAWRGDSVVQVAAARLHRPPPNPRDLRVDIPDALVAVVFRAMARRPDDRYATSAPKAPKQRSPGALLGGRARRRTASRRRSARSNGLDSFAPPSRRSRAR